MSKEQDKNQDKREKEAFDQAFGDLLGSAKKKESAPRKLPSTSLEEELFGPDEETVFNEEDWKDASEEYIPSSVHSEEWEEFVSRPPLPPLDREQEARAVSIGLQELRKTKEYTQYIFRHMTKEFKTIYITYPLLFEKFYENAYGKVHKEINALIEDMEHFIAGEISKVKAVQDDFRLTQAFEEKRLSVLYEILEFYNKKQ